MYNLQACWRNHRWLVGLWLGIGLGLLSPLLAHAQSLAPAAITESVVLTTTDDAYIHSQNISKNFGNEPQLIVSDGGTVLAIQQRALLSFDLSTLPAGAIVNKAILRMHQNEALSPWELTIARIETPWDEATVTWETQPRFVPQLSGLATPVQKNIDLDWDVTPLVQDWVHEIRANQGFLIDGQSSNALRNFDSSEGANPPKLLVEYILPPDTLHIPYDPTAVKVDGTCDLAEYAKAATFPYLDLGGTLQRLAIKQNDDSLFVCINGIVSNNPDHSFSLTLDRDNGREKYPNGEDYNLEARLSDGVLNSFVGTNDPGLPWKVISNLLWKAVVAPRPNGPESAEFQIPLTLLSTVCSRPFGLALFHQQINAAGETTGWPQTPDPNSPDSWITATLARPNCPIQVCLEKAAPCQPAANARIMDTNSGATFAVDAQGIVQRRIAIPDNATLWAVLPVSNTRQSSLFYTSGAPQSLVPGVFDGVTPGVMSLVISQQAPIRLQNLTVSTEWYVQADPSKEEWLRTNIISASNFLYQYTNGQMALGNVTVQQSMDSWDEVNMRVQRNNTLRPRAAIGGIVPTTTLDPGAPTITVTYSPGQINMGSYWNRYGKPPGETITVSGTVVAPETLQEDWAIAFSHELGHYLLFLFDTYTDPSGAPDPTATASCTGSAMNNPFEPSNRLFVFSQPFWNTNCGATEAYARLHGRTEWDTIHLWHPWTVVPTTTVIGPSAPPITLTRVNFITPTTPPGIPASSQIFDLLYVDNETTSSQARAFILRNNQVMDQGRPPKGQNKLTLLDAQVNDRLCVFDINDQPATLADQRNQFGCELIQLNDNQLQLTKNIAWAPVVEMQQTARNQLQIIVSQTITAPVGAAPPSVVAVLYPEYKAALSTITLVNNGGILSGTFVLTRAVPPAYLQLFVNESPVAPISRRETIVDRGTGGSGAFGPKSFLGGVFVVSTDGEASYEDSDTTNLGDGDSITWQSMPGIPRLPPFLKVLGQAYRLDAFPIQLVNRGKVNLRFRELPGQQTSVYYWNGERWRKLPTIVSIPEHQAHGDGHIYMPSQQEDDLRLATAPSQGRGVYAVLMGSEPQTQAPTLYLPMVRR